MYSKLQYLLNAYDSILNNSKHIIKKLHFVVCRIKKRKSYNTINVIFFFKATIHKRLPLLALENYQELVINYLKKLSDECYLTIYDFVLMPNHIHLFWRQNKLNGKELAQSSFLKLTAHPFLKKLKDKGQ